MSEEMWRVDALFGVKELRRTPWSATWKSHDRLDIVGEHVAMYDADETFLGMLLMTGGTYEFTNERPPKPTVWSRLGRLLRPGVKSA